MPITEQASQHASQPAQFCNGRGLVFVRLAADLKQQVNMQQLQHDILIASPVAVNCSSYSNPTVPRMLTALRIDERTCRRSVDSYQKQLVANNN